MTHFPSRFEKCRNEEKAENAVRRNNCKLAELNLPFQVKHCERCNVTKLFDERRRHDGPVPKWIYRYHKENDLPREGNRDESVVKIRMRDRRRILTIHNVEQEVHRCHHDYSPDTSY